MALLVVAWPVGQLVGATQPYTLKGGVKHKETKLMNRYTIGRCAGSIFEGITCGDACVGAARTGASDEGGANVGCACSGIRFE